MSMQGQRRKHRDARAAGDRSGLSLLAVQSIVCGVVLLLVLLLRLIGGETWEGLRSLFHRWMTDEGITRVMTEHTEDTTAEESTVGNALSVHKIADAETNILSLPTGAVPPLKSGVVTSPYGIRTDPINGGTGFHTGVDISAPEGTELCAMYEGEVSVASWDKSYGWYVTIRCNGSTEITYAHCSALLCREGERVQAGQTVALVGSTGDSTGSHVHVMLANDGVYQDPRPLIPEAWYA